MRPPKEKWSKTAAALDAISAAIVSITRHVPLLPDQRGLVSLMEISVAELRAYVEQAEECEQD